MPKEKGVDTPEIASTETVQIIGDQPLNFQNPEPDFTTQGEDSGTQDKSDEPVHNIGQPDDVNQSGTTTTLIIPESKVAEGDIASHLSIELSQEDNHKIQMGEVNELPDGTSLKDYQKNLLAEQTRQEQERANLPMSLADLDKPKVSVNNSTNSSTGTVNANSSGDIGSGNSGTGGSV